MHIPMQSYQASEHNHHPKSFIFLPSQRPKKQPLLWFFSLEKFPCSRISLKWKSHSMNYFYIASFTWHNFWESSILFCKYQKVTSYTTGNLFPSWWRTGCFQLWATNKTAMTIYKPFYEYVFISQQWSC